MRNLDAIIRVCMLLCETSMLLFVFRIMFVLIGSPQNADHADCRLQTADRADHADRADRADCPD